MYCNCPIINLKPKKMLKTEFTVVKISWGEKIRITKDLDFVLGGVENCIYQAYGDSPIYGRDVLLYIGKTKRDIIHRTQEHIHSDFERILNLHLIIGTIEEPFLKAVGPEKAISICESLLITMMKPSYNSFNIKDTGAHLKGEEKYLLCNHGNRGDLPLEVSNVWWTEKATKGFIGVETYYHNGDTGVTWFYNDLELTEESFKKLLDLITNHDEKEITQNASGAFQFYPGEVNPEEPFDHFGTFVWEDTNSRYPKDLENMNVDQLPDYGIIRVSQYLNELFKLIH